METKQLPIISTLLVAGFFTLLSLASFGAESADKVPAEHGDIQIIPINHATFAMEWNGKGILVDPVGGEQKIRAKFAGAPDLILVTDIHGDHMNADTLKVVAQGNAKIIAP